MKNRTLLIVLILTLSFGIAMAQELPLIKAVEVRGNKKIEADTIKAKIKSEVGKPLSEDTIRQDIKAIYKIGYFSDIKVETEPFEGGVKLIYIVKEKPTIGRIEYHGNKKIDTDKIRGKVTITPGAIYDMSLIQDNADKIRELYEGEGYYLVKVTPVIKTVSEDEVALTFNIDEGPKVVIKKITIEGNKRVSSSEIKKAMKTKERWFLSFITGSGYYKKDVMEDDIQRIKDVYLNKGFLHIAVSEPKLTLSPDKKDLYITIAVSEGQQYRVGEVKLEGNKVFSTDEIMKKIKTKTGAIFSKEVLRKDVLDILDMYSEKGYATANVSILSNIDDAKRLIDLTLDITEGDLYRVGRIEITGNVRTRDKVIRREMRLAEGDIYNSKLLKRSYERINNLNFFDSVDLAPKPEPEKKVVDIDVKVKERPTGAISVGGGYSSVDKFVVMGEITQGNLFGTGKQLKLSGQIGGVTRTYRISYIDPYFMDRPISASLTLYNETNNYQQYTNYSWRSKGVELAFGKRFGDYYSANIAYNFDNTDIYNITDTASSLIKNQAGIRTTSSISPSFIRDSRDNFLDPSRGSRNAIYTTVAGLGGSNKFYKIVLDSAWYFPLPGDTTFSARGRLGFASGLFGKEVPVNERFYVGGLYTVRGLGYGEAGPRDSTGEIIGGTKELIGNFEYVFPIVKELKFKGVTFFDIGRAFDTAEKIELSRLRYTAVYRISPRPLQRQGLGCRPL